MSPSLLLLCIWEGITLVPRAISISLHFLITNGDFFYLKISTFIGELIV